MSENCIAESDHTSDYCENYTACTACKDFAHITAGNENVGFVYYAAGRLDKNKNTVKQSLHISLFQLITS